MEKFMLGKKAGMTQLFSEDGTAIPVTVIDCGPVFVLQVKTTDTEGYDSIKVGYSDVSENKLNKPDKGQFTKAEVATKKHIREFRAEGEFEVAQEIKVSDMFQVGDKVDVSGVSKGKGFAGPIKRHNQSTGPKTHGSKYHRRVGSMGAAADPGRVLKGTKLPGHMGSVNVTVQNLEVVLVDGERNILALKGAVPGPNGGKLLEIKNTVKFRR